MVKSTKKHFVLESGEYIIFGGDILGLKIQVFDKGEQLHDVVAIVRSKKLEEIK